MSAIQRLIERDGHGQSDSADRPEFLPLEEWLDYLEHRRAVILMELRQLEPLLIKYGRLKSETPRRIR